MNGGVHDAGSGIWTIIAVGEKLWALNITGHSISKAGRFTSHNDRGETAHREQWYEATNDRFFKESSIHIEIKSAVGKNTYCRVIDIKKEIITLKNDGIDVHIEVVSKFLVAAHAETGSGLANIGKTAWIEATVEADLVEYKK